MVLAFFEALTDGDDDAPRFLPAFPPLRGDGV